MRARRKLTVFYETSDLGAGPVVDPTSADAAIPGVDPEPLDGDHIEVSKPTSREDQRYARTMRFIRSVIDEDTVIAQDSAGDALVFERTTIENKRPPYAFVPLVLRLLVLIALVFVIVKGIGVIVNPDPEPLTTEEIEAAVAAQLDARTDDAESALATADMERQLSDAISKLNVLIGGLDLSKDEAKVIKDDVLSGRTGSAVSAYVDYAETAGRAARQADLDAADAWRNAGTLAYFSDPDEALTYFRKASEIEPQDAQTWLAIAHLSTQLGESEEARRALDRILTIADSADIDRGERVRLRAAAYCGLGSYHFVARDVPLALDYLGRGIALGEDPNAGVSASMLAVCYSTMGQTELLGGDRRAALDYSKKALVLWNETNNLSGVAHAYATRSAYHVNLGEFDEGIANLENALEIDRPRERWNSVAHHEGNLGHIYLLQGRLDLSREHYTRALELSRDATGNRGNEAYNLLSLGYVKLREKKLDEAEAFYLDSLETYEAIQRDEGIALCKSALAGVSRERGDPADLVKATELLVEASEINGRLGLRARLADDYQQLGIVYRDRDQPTAAADYLARALDIYEKTGPEDRLSAGYFELGKLHLSTESFKDAIDAFERAAEVALRLGRLELAGISESNIGKAHQAIGDDRLAREHWQRSVTLLEQAGSQYVESVTRRLEKLDAPGAD